MLLSVRAAIDTQLAALRTTTLLREHQDAPFMRDIAHGWRIDSEMLMHALPVAWAPETIDAVRKASELEMPGDTMFNRWNLPSDMAWWWFEDPLPIPTNDVSVDPLCPPDLPDHLKMPPVRALMCGWCKDGPSRVFRVSVWTEDPLNSTRHLDGVQTTITVGHSVPSQLNLTGKLIPSQTWCWMENETLDQMLTRLAREHDKQYGPKGTARLLCEPFPKTMFMDASTRLSKFILAAMAWFDQKILVTQDEPVERHLRKEFNKRTGRDKKDTQTMKVIHLRKRTYPAGNGNPSGEHREYDHQWLVERHWRNQACGKGWSDRKLILIKSYLKGPADKPIKEHTGKVVVVDR